jgi:hypothetical protein
MEPTEEIRKGKEDFTTKGTKNTKSTKICFLSAGS